jgi:tetratricopeptide (TPR) repeat protein
MTDPIDHEPKSSGRESLVWLVLVGITVITLLGIGVGLLFLQQESDDSEFQIDAAEEKKAHEDVEQATSRLEEFMSQDKAKMINHDEDFPDLNEGYDVQYRDAYLKLVSKGKLSFIHGEFEGALATFKKCHEMKPDDFGMTRQVSVCYRKMKKPIEALEWLRKAIPLANNEPTHYRAIAHDLIRLEQYDEGIEYASKAIAQSKLRPALMSRLLGDRAVAYARTGKRELALKDFAEAEKTAMGDPELTQILNLHRQEAFEGPHRSDSLKD